MMKPAPGMRLAGAGYAVPTNSTPNAVIEERLGLGDGWIESRTGILSRPTASECEATSDLAVEAVRQSLAASGVSACDVGLLLLATSTPDHLLPPTAPLVAHRVGLKTAGAIDVTGACSGFLYALVMGHASGAAMARPVIVAGANILSRRVNPRNASTAALFADGAGAVVLAPTDRPQILGVHLAADGAFYDAIRIPAGGSREPLTEKGLREGRHLMEISEGKAAFRKAVTMMAEAGQQALKQAVLTVENVRWWIPHQANLRIIEQCGKALDIPMSRTVVTIDRCANSSAATIPIALAKAVERGAIERGDILLLTAAGAGMISAGVVLRF